MENSTSEKDFCKAKCASVQRQLLAMNEFFSAGEMISFDEADLMVRIESAESLKAEFDISQSRLEKLDLLELSTDARSDFEKVYWKIKSTLARQMDVVTKGRMTDANSTTIPRFAESTHTFAHLFNRKSRLPELQLPRFSGSYEDWPDFYAMYKTVIGSNEDLSKIEKLQHLRACLDGAALNTIKSLEPVDVNYDKALELLIKRFDNKLLHFQGHVRAIVGLPGVEKGSAEALRELSDKINSHLRALSTMSTTEELADGLLIHTISHKLDHHTQEKWQEALATDKLPRWTDMSAFLEKRCRMMENLKGATAPTPSHQKTRMTWRYSRLGTSSGAKPMPLSTSQT
ncbi:uncharacterized protein LOC135438811 isoform X4 [Drosophila montana]|uniref:uncharacterized protein LOC135438811 isoform X4 n=1 Tax=Drosophila montana TaxID=40370 RepID=UPI00313BFB2C